MIYPLDPIHHDISIGPHPTSTITDAFDMEKAMDLAMKDALSKQGKEEEGSGGLIGGPAARLTELNWYGLLIFGLCLWFVPLFVVTESFFAHRQYHPGDTTSDTTNAGPEMWGVFVGAAGLSILLWLVFKVKVASDLLGTEFSSGRFERVAIYFLFSIYFLLNAAELITAYLGIAGPCMLYMTFFLMSFSKLPLNTRLMFTYSMLLFYIVSAIPSLLWLDTVSNTRYNAKRRMLHGTAYLVVSFLAAVPMKLQAKLKAREQKLSQQVKALTDAQATKNELSQKLLLNVLPEEIIPRFIALGHQEIQTIKQNHLKHQAVVRAKSQRGSKKEQKEQEMTKLGKQPGDDDDDDFRQSVKWTNPSSKNLIKNAKSSKNLVDNAAVTRPLGSLSRHNSSGRDMIAAMKRQSSVSYIPTTVVEEDDDDDDGDVMAKAARKSKKMSRGSIFSKSRKSTLKQEQQRLKRVSTSSAIVRKIGPQRTNSGRVLGRLGQEGEGQVRAPTKVIADTYHECTILFAYTYGLTELCKDLTTIDAVNVLNEVVCRCDNVATACHIVKIKTIGTCYMAACGLPSPNPYHAINMVEAALGIVQEIKKFSEHIRAGDTDDDDSGHKLSYKIGLSSGPVVGGIIGSDKFCYDVWGDTVNTASRMYSHASKGTIQVTEPTYKLLREHYDFNNKQAEAWDAANDPSVKHTNIASTHKGTGGNNNDGVRNEKGEVNVKGKGWMRTWDCLGRKVGVTVKPQPADRLNGWGATSIREVVRKVSQGDGKSIQRIIRASPTSASQKNLLNEQEAKEAKEVGSPGRARSHGNSVPTMNDNPGTVNGASPGTLAGSPRVSFANGGDQIAAADGEGDDKNARTRSASSAPLMQGGGKKKGRRWSKAPKTPSKKPEAAGANVRKHSAAAAYLDKRQLEKKQPKLTLRQQAEQRERERDGYEETEADKEDRLVEAIFHRPILASWIHLRKSLPTVFPKNGGSMTVVEMKAREMEKEFAKARHEDKESYNQVYNIYKYNALHSRFLRLYALTARTHCTYSLHVLTALSLRPLIPHSRTLAFSRLFGWASWW
jgi:class 3 adenylate cyclase